MGLHKIEDIFDTLIKYLELKSELVKLQIKEQFSDIITSMVIFFILLFFLLLFFLTGSIVLAIVINRAMGSVYIGYLVLMGIHILLFLLLFVNRRGVIKSLIYSFVFEDHAKSIKEDEDE